MKYSYKIIRSNRKTVGLEIQRDESILVRAPLQMTNREIEEFVQSHANWIETHLVKVRQRRQQAAESAHLTYAQILELGDRALEVIPKRVEYFAARMGVTYGRITIRNQRTRWGSCSAKGNLNFNCLLMLMPEEILDYVVVHELAHRKEMNHSPAFWSIVESVLPDYRERREWLKENGGVYMQMQMGS